MPHPALEFIERAALLAEKLGRGEVAAGLCRLSEAAGQLFGLEPLAFTLMRKQLAERAANPPPRTL